MTIKHQMKSFNISEYYDNSQVSDNPTRYSSNCIPGPPMKAYHEWSAIS